MCPPSLYSITHKYTTPFIILEDNCKHPHNHVYTHRHSDICINYYLFSLRNKCVHGQKLQFSLIILITLVVVTNLLVGRTYLGGKWTYTKSFGPSIEGKMVMPNVKCHIGLLLFQVLVEDKVLAN